MLLREKQKIKGEKNMVESVAEKGVGTIFKRNRALCQLWKMVQMRFDVNEIIISHIQFSDED